MKRVYSLILAFGFTCVAFAAENVVLIKGSHMPQVRAQLAQQGLSATGQLQSTGELIIPEKGLSFEQIKQKVSGLFPAATIREISVEELNGLKASQPKKAASLKPHTAK